MRVLSLSVRPKLRSPFFHQPELNSFPSEYIGSTAVGRGSSAACSLGQRSFLGFLFVRPPPPMFLVSVAFKGLRYCASSLFETQRRGLRSVASKGLRLHQNCAKGTVGRALDLKGDLKGNRPYGLAKSAESHDSKGLRERCSERGDATSRSAEEHREKRLNFHSCFFSD